MFSRRLLFQTQNKIKWCDLLDFKLKMCLIFKFYFVNLIYFVFKFIQYYFFFRKLRSSVYLVSLNKSKQLTIKLMSSSNFPHLGKPSAKNLGYRKPDGWIPSNIIRQSVAGGSHYGMSIYNGNRSEWSPIRSVIVRVIGKIGRPRGGIPICQSRVWLQAKLEDTKSCYQSFITVTISERKNTFRTNISDRDNV